LEGVVGTPRYMFECIPERIDRFSSSGHCGFVATVRALLGCGSIRSGIQKRGRGVSLYLFSSIPAELGHLGVDSTPGQGPATF
jgi:hypothetical protein